jgi:hypothetical protein
MAETTQIGSGSADQRGGEAMRPKEVAMPNLSQEQMMVELKPCPFCGGKGYAYERQLSSAESSSCITEGVIECGPCGCEIYGLDLADAIDNWNTRAILSTGDDAGLVELIERCQRIADYSEAYRSGVAASCLREAAAAILSLTARNKALEDALRPFAAIAEWYGDKEDDDFEVQADWPHGWPFAKNALALRHFRDARAALNHQDNRQKGDV